MGNKSGKKSYKSIDNKNYPPHYFQEESIDKLKYPKTAERTQQSRQFPEEAPQQAPIIIQFKHDVIISGVSNAKSKELLQGLMSKCHCMHFHERTSTLFVATAARTNEHNLPGCISVIRMEKAQWDGGPTVYRLIKLIKFPIESAQNLSLNVDCWNRLVIVLEQTRSIYAIKNWNKELPSGFIVQGEDLRIDSLIDQRFNWVKFSLSSELLRNEFPRNYVFKNKIYGEKGIYNFSGQKDDKIYLTHLKSKKLLRRYSRAYPQSGADFLNVIDFDIDKDSIVVACQGLAYQRKIFGGTLGKEVILKTNGNSFQPEQAQNSSKPLSETIFGYLLTSTRP